MKAALGLGSNLGDRAGYLRIAEEGLNERLGRITSKVNEVLPLVIAAVTRGAVLDVDAFPRMLRGLAEIETLARALRN